MSGSVWRRRHRRRSRHAPTSARAQGAPPRVGGATLDLESFTTSEERGPAITPTSLAYNSKGMTKRALRLVFTALFLALASSATAQEKPPKFKFMPGPKPGGGEVKTKY